MSSRIDLDDCPVIDHHCHPFPASSATVSPLELAGQFALAGAAVTNTITEFLSPPEIDALLRRDLHTSVVLDLATRDLARFLGCEQRWEAVVDARNARAQADYGAFVGALVADAAIAGLIVEDGPSNPRIPIEEFASRSPVPLTRIARLENHQRDLLSERDLGFDELRRRYRDALEADVAAGAVGFKSLIAYRTGLDVDPGVSEGDARRAFEARHLNPPARLKPLRDLLFAEAAAFAREHDLWLHVHTGIGDVDIVYERSQPSHLFPFLKDARYQRTKTVLIHGGYPFVREAASMAAVLPNVFLDVSVPTLFALSGLRQSLREALEICPVARILYGSDGSMPETYWLAARRTRIALGDVLGELVDDGFVSEARAHEYGRLILGGNAQNLYAIG